MSTLGVIFISIIIFVLVFILCVVQIKKGYAYKHTIDTLPMEEEKTRRKE
ncbi:YtzI protein [Oceanobacillus bengalensis]|uniref:YtzI protein n=1 Tax=Oceanobacillus bengalensis TaxID=1435466 RepID=A0A494Z4I4_9BACI|nr:YtzI protein [Oceanobacillus bengalensis]